jgi:guanine deaminase
MQLALEEARQGMRSRKGGPFGAVIVKDGELLSIACNEVLASNDPTAHAEVTAIRRACRKLGTYDLSGCIIYVTGEPCPMCLSAIVWANIKTAYFALAASEAEKLGFRDNMIYRHLRGQETILDVRQIDSEEVIALYEEYQKQGNVIY